MVSGDFKIEIPITIKGDKSKNIGEQIAEAFSKKTKVLMGSIGIGGGKSGGKGGSGIGVLGKGIGKIAGT